MVENHKLPTNLRRIVEKELEATEIIRWIEQPIPRFFTRATVGTSLVLFIPIIVFSFAGFMMYSQAKDRGEFLFDFPYG